MLIDIILTVLLAIVFALYVEQRKTVSQLKKTLLEVNPNSETKLHEGAAKSSISDELKDLSLAQKIILFKGNYDDAWALANAIYKRHTVVAGHVRSSYFHTPDEEICGPKLNQLYVVSKQEHDSINTADIQIAIEKDFSNRRKAKVGKIVCLLPELENAREKDILSKLCDIEITKDHPIYQAAVSDNV